MEFSAAVIAGLLTPILDLALNAKAKMFWPYLFSGALIAALVYVRGPAAHSLGGFWRYLFPRDVYAHVSTWADYKIWIANCALVLPLIVPFSLLAGSWANDAVRQLLPLLTGAQTPGWQAGWTARGAFTVCELLAIDGGLFLAHYLQHRVPLLWEFHKTHHSAETLTPITVFRMHPVDLLFNSLLVTVLMGGVAGLFASVYSAPVSAFALNGMNIGLFLFYFAGMHLRHSHVWLTFPGWIGRHISSPALHQIHHSTDPKHYDKNLAQIFTFWDRMTGTLYLPSGEEEISYGLSDGEHERFRGLFALYLRPVENAFALLRGRSPGRTWPAGA